MKLPMILAVLVVPVLVTIGALGLWASTNYHAYTKYEVVERVPVEVDEEDPFAGTGLFEGEDGAPVYQTVQRESFHFGILPTPQGLFDKHMASVVTVVAPVWFLSLAFLGLVAWRHRRRARASA
jgi:hypothetical protein